jgi:hypothetical protein
MNGNSGRESTDEELLNGIAYNYYGKKYRELKSKIMIGYCDRVFHKAHSRWPSLDRLATI